MDRAGVKLALICRKSRSRYIWIVDPDISCVEPDISCVEPDISFVEPDISCVIDRLVAAATYGSASTLQ